MCLKKDIPADRMAEIKPTSISSTSTFVVDQKFAKVKHPFDVEADETLGAYEKKEQTRFYEVKVNDEGELLISSEVSVNKGSKGIVVGGAYNTRDGRNWVKQVANKKHLYAVVRKRAVHKKTMQKVNTAFTRYVIFIMPIAENNEIYGRLKNMQSYTLKCPTMIMHYYFNSEDSVPLVASAHGNATRMDLALQESTLSSKPLKRLSIQTSVPQGLFRTKSRKTLTCLIPHCCQLLFGTISSCITTGTCTWRGKIKNERRSNSGSNS